MVALGTLFSTFWILASNSWLHTPAGYEMINGVVHPVDWFEVVFNPSFPYRLAHMAIGSFITTCFVVGGARYLRRKEHVEAGRKMLGAAVIFAAITVPVQIFVGDMHGLNTLKHQPMKIAAVEAHWHQGQEGEGVPLVVFAVPNEKEERNDLEIAIPRVGSLILTHSMDGTFAPLTSVPASERPPVTPVFFAFRIMVGIGTLMLLLARLSAFTRPAVSCSIPGPCCALGTGCFQVGSLLWWPAGLSPRWGASLGLSMAFCERLMPWDRKRPDDSDLTRGLCRWICVRIWLGHLVSGQDPPTWPTCPRRKSVARGW